MMWSLAQYFKAIDWWRSETHGTGHFNQELYERIIQIKYGITIKN